MRLAMLPGSTTLLFIAIAGCSLSPSLSGDDKPPDKRGENVTDAGLPPENDLTNRRIAFAKQGLARFTIKVGDRKEEAKASDPCLRWSYPGSRTKDGDGIIAVYAFNGGRPAVIAEFYKIGGVGEWCNEFAIIAPSDVTIMREGRPFWKPSDYICKFTDVPDAPAPAAKPALRLSQMRKIAEDFSVIVHDGWQEAEISKHSLRLLPQPVYRYSEEGTILDGGLFVLTMEPHPQCLLLIEANENEKGMQYRYALAPMSYSQLDASHKDKPVWTIE